jgi:hypothetical protein
MKYVIMILSVLILSSCDFTDDKKEPNTVSKPVEIKELENSDTTPYHRYYQIYTLDGCEYIVVGIGSNTWGTHKGNCKNPIHKKDK